MQLMKLKPLLYFCGILLVLIIKNKKMDKRLKIMLGVVVALGIISGLFLFFAKKSPAPVAAPKTVQATSPVKSLNPLPVEQDNAAATKTTPAPKPATAAVKTPQVSSDDRKILVQSQWTQCKAKS